VLPVFCLHALGEPAMASNWLYSLNGQQNGPISAAKLKQLAADGGIGPDDLVCQEGSSNWVPAKRVKGLLPPTTSSTATSTPTAQPASNSDLLPQIQVRVSDTLRGIGDAVQSVAGSEPVKAAGESLKNAAGRAAGNVGNFIRSGAVQSQVKAARNFWSDMPMSLKALLIGGPVVGVLLLSCCGGTLLLMGGGKAKNLPQNSVTQTSSQRKPSRLKTTPAYDEGYRTGRDLAESMYRPIEEFKVRLTTASSPAEKRSVLDAIKSQLDRAVTVHAPVSDGAG